MQSKTESIELSIVLNCMKYLHRLGEWKCIHNNKNAAIDRERANKMLTTTKNMMVLCDRMDD